MAIVFNPFSGNIEQKLKHIKLDGVSTSPISNFNSNIPTNVPGMTLTISIPGDYIFYGLINCNNDQNEEVDFYLAIDNSTITNQVVTDTQKKKQDQCIQGTFVADGLTSGQVITFQLNTRNDNVDIENRRWIGQAWE